MSIITKTIGVICFVIVGVFGFIIGSTTVEPEIVTKTKEVEVIKEVPGPVQTKEVEVEVTPQICLEAIDSADAAFAKLSDAIVAIDTGQDSTELTAELSELMDDYNSQSLDCYLSGM